MAVYLDKIYIMAVYLDKIYIVAVYLNKIYIMAVYEEVEKILPQQDMEYWVLGLGRK